MHNNQKLTAPFVSAAVVALLAGCGNDGPTSNSGLAPNFRSGALSPRSQTDEQFNCTNVGEVHVRFSDPGSIDESTATLFYSFAAVADGTHGLTVIWDEDNAPLIGGSVSLEAGTTPGTEEGFVDIKGTVAHTYADVLEETKRTVRVELTLDGQTGNCSTVRHITLPGPPPSKVVCVTVLGGSKPGISIPHGCPVIK